MVNLMIDNEMDVEMLHSDPRGLVLRYQETVRIIVKKYTASGLFKPADFEDVVQEINASLLAKMPMMQVQYNGISLFRTYFSVIVRNICLKIHERSKRNFEVDIETIGEMGFNSVEDRTAIEQEIRRFRAILGLYRKQRPKLLLCLKVRYRIPVSSEDLAGWYPHLPSDDVTTLLEHFAGDYDGVGDREIYKTLMPIVNRLERKHSTPDALRKWTDSKIQDILGFLNGPPSRTKHTPETLKILVDDFFSPFLIEK